MRAPTEILGIRYFLLGVIFTRTDTRVESSHQGPPQNKNKSFSFHFQTARAFGPGLLILLYVLPAPLGRTTTYYHILLRGFRLLVPSRPGLISYHIRVQYPLYPVYSASKTLPGVAGEWWWASNECASLPKEGPLGPVLKRSHSRMWVTRWVTASKCGDVTGFGTCVAAPGCRQIDKMLMERVYGGHIMVHHPWGKWLLGWCAYAGTS